MRGVIERTITPSIVSIRRSTPLVAGWCGPMLIVKSSVSGSSSVPNTGSPGAPMRSSVTERSRSRYGTSSGASRPTPVAGASSLIPARHLVLVEGEEDGLAAHREVAPLRVALVVLGHQDATQVGVAVEDHAEHVVDLALLEVGAGEEVHHRGHGRLVEAQAGLHAEAVRPLHAQELVVDREPRLVREVVAPVEAHEQWEGLLRLLAEVAEHVVHGGWHDLQRRLLAEVV